MTRFFQSRPGKWPALAALGLLLGTAACTSDEELNRRAAGQTETTTAPTVTTPPADAARPAPLRVNVFLELSGGMKGFMPVNTAATQPTEFQDYVSQLASRTHSSPAVADAQFLLALQDTPTVTTYKHFRDVVQGDTREAAKGTELPDMLENMLALPGAADKVNVVVSDFIYGPQDKSAIALMKVRMTDALATVSKKQLAVAMLAGTSRFHGTFHPAVKTPQKQLAVAGQPLPYYVWVIGPPALVGRYLNEVTPGGGAQQAFFGLVLTQVKAGSPLAPGGEGSVSFATGEPSTQLDVSDVQAGVEFSVALNLAQLPAAWREPAFLNKNLRAQLNGGTVRIVPNSVQLTKDEAALAAYTHTLRLRLTALPKGAATLQLSLPAPETPAWVAAWSTQNDNQLSNPPRTYRLDDIAAGVRGAYPTPLPPVFTASFTLTQD
jgi:hypothetical protein